MGILDLVNDLRALLYEDFLSLPALAALARVSRAYYIELVKTYDGPLYLPAAWRKKLAGDANGLIYDAVAQMKAARFLHQIKASHIELKLALTHVDKSYVSLINGLPVYRAANTYRVEMTAGDDNEQCLLEWTTRIFIDGSKVPVAVPAITPAVIARFNRVAGAAHERRLARNRERRSRGQKRLNVMLRPHRDVIASVSGSIMKKIKSLQRVKTHKGLGEHRHHLANLAKEALALVAAFDTIDAIEAAHEDDPILIDE